MNTYWIAADGRLDLPLQQRRHMGLENGGAVSIEAHDGHLVIRPVDRLLSDIQALVQSHIKPGMGPTVDEFIAERREEEARETTGQHG